MSLAGAGKLAVNTNMCVCACVCMCVKVCGREGEEEAGALKERSSTTGRALAGYSGLTSDALSTTEFGRQVIRELMHVMWCNAEDISWLFPNRALHSRAHLCLIATNTRSL